LYGQLWVAGLHAAAAALSEVISSWVGCCDFQIETSRQVRADENAEFGVEELAAAGAIRNEGGVPYTRIDAICASDRQVSPCPPRPARTRLRLEMAGRDVADQPVHETIEASQALMTAFTHTSCLAGFG